LGLPCEDIPQFTLLVYEVTGHLALSWRANTDLVVCIGNANAFDASSTYNLLCGQGYGSSQNNMFVIANDVGALQEAATSLAYWKPIQARL
jgi:hypothetical protein